MLDDGGTDFEEFVVNAEPRLRRALLGTVGLGRMPDAVAEALAYAWEHWEEVSAMVNPVGYLFRVGQSRTRVRSRPLLPPVDGARIPEVEPALASALMRLPRTQRTAVWLAYGCGWPHSEIAEVLGTATSTVSTHVSRALDRLRAEIGVSAHG